VKKRTKVLLLTAGALLLVAGAVALAFHQINKDTIIVQTAPVVRQDLTSIVSASGEIKPKVFVNVGANAFGKIVKLYVHEGERVHKDQLLAQIENVQSSADVEAMRAQLQATRTDSAAAAASQKTAQANLARSRAEAERARLDYQRAEKLFQEQLIPKSQFDTAKATWESADAAVNQAEAQLAQAAAQQQSAASRIGQYQATLTRASDVLSKTIYTAPFDGVITNLPVREGETVVIGIQNSPGSTLMTLADMSVITAEVKVDETDIVNVEVGQFAEVTIDAIPNQTFRGAVTEIGNNAMLRSTGISTSQTIASSQEAKDFKVVVTISDPPQGLRPGLSATARVTTATRRNAVAIPIQALTARQRSELKSTMDAGNATAKEKSEKSKDATANPAKDREEVQGVFVIRSKKAEFVPVQTGIAGITEIEIRSGLQPGDEIVTGSYKALRTLRTGSTVKVDNSPPSKQSADNS
jgi:HlyD family secretion protein